MKKLKPGKDYIGVGGGVLILNDKGETLLLKRGMESKNEAGWWCKPGGTVEYGENSMKAMMREIKEEIGVDIDVWGMLPNTDHIIRKEKQHWLAVNFLARIKKGKPKIMEPRKHEEIKWFSLKKIPKKTTQTTREPIRNYLTKRYIEL